MSTSSLTQPPTKASAFLRTLPAATGSSSSSAAPVRRSVSSTSAAPMTSGVFGRSGCVMRCCCHGGGTDSTSSGNYVGSEEVLSQVSSTSTKSTMLLAAAANNPSSTRPSLLLKRYKSHIFGGGGSDLYECPAAVSTASSDEFFVSSGNYRASCPNIYESNVDGCSSVDKAWSSSCDALNSGRLFDYAGINEYITDSNDYRVVSRRGIVRDSSFVGSSDMSDSSTVERRSDLFHLDDRSRFDLYRRRSCGVCGGLERWFRPLSHFPSMASTTLSYCKGYTNPRKKWWMGSANTNSRENQHLARRISTVQCLLSISTKQIPSRQHAISNKFSISETNVY